MRIPATADFRVEKHAISAYRRGGVEQMQTVMRIAFHRQYLSVRGEQLLEYGHLKHAPEQIAFQCGQFAVTDAREYDDRGVDRRQRHRAGFDRFGQPA
jgi:hypothetical protein